MLQGSRDGQRSPWRGLEWRCGRRCWSRVVCRRPRDSPGILLAIAPSASSHRRTRVNSSQSQTSRSTRRSTQYPPPAAGHHRPVTSSASNDHRQPIQTEDGVRVPVQYPASEAG